MTALDRPFSKTIRWLLVVLTALVPVSYVARQWDPDTGFTGMLLFSSKLHPRALKSVQEMRPALSFPSGYDGHFYAQLAVEPLLRDPQLNKALDDPAYRARRILLPALAHVLGFGVPRLVVNAYALLSLAFWLLLLAGMVHYLHVWTWRSALCVAGAVFSTGPLICVQRALPDLPAATLAFFAASWTGAAAVGATSLALLTKETSLLFALRFAWPLPKNRAEWARLALTLAVICIPFVLWVSYVKATLVSGSAPMRHFGWPLSGAISHIQAAWTALLSTEYYLSVHLSDWEWRLWELLAPVSALVQVGWFAARPRIDSAYWRMGAGFALMFVFLAPPAFKEQIGYIRIVLPMAIAFNIGLMQERGLAWVLWFAAGNGGLLWAFRQMISGCLL